MKERPLAVLSAAFVAVWAIFMLTFYLMKFEIIAIDHIGDPLLDETLRDAAALATLLVWIFVFYIIRNYVSRVLGLS